MTDQALAVPDVSGSPARIVGKLRTALLAMVWEGLPYDQAARRANFHVRSMRQALERPHVLSFIRRQKQVMREAASGANVLALTEVRDQRDNQMARVQAVKALEQLSDTDQGRGGAAQAQPGLVIQIITNSGVGSVVGRPTTTIDQQLIDQSNQGDSE